MRAFTREGARSSYAASSNSHSMRNNSSSRSCPGMIPPPLEMFTGPRKKPFDSLFRLAGELCHLPGASVFLITPEKHEAIGFRKRGQDATGLFLQQRPVDLFLIGRDN